MAMGPKEAARRALREAKAQGVQKKRTPAASPKAEALPVPVVAEVASEEGEKINTRGPGRPRGPERVPILVKVSPEMIRRLGRTKARLGLETRNDTINAILDKGADK